jgi:hypothetical protein
MTSERLRQLHDRYTRNDELSSSELEELNAWYAAEDRAEAAELSAAVDPPHLQVLRSEVAAAVSRLSEMAVKIRELCIVNEELRGEIVRYRQELAKLPTVHQA